MSSSQTPVRGSQSSSRRTKVRGSVGEWSGSEGSGNESGGGSYAHPSTSSSMAGLSVSAAVSRAGSSQSISRSGLENLTLDPVVCGDIFDPMYSLAPATSSVSGPGLVQNVPLISPLDGVNPFNFPLDPALTLDEGALEYLDDMDVGLTDEVFHVEDWSRYMWSPETGFEHLDTGYPAVSQ